jgi:uncharacterized phage protein gp47/JayE
MSGGTGFGITPQGFVAPQLTDLQTNLNQSLQSQIGADINTQAESFFGQLTGIMAFELSLVWQAMQDVYGSQTPDTAFGASLDNVGSLRGIPRLQAAPSIVQNVKLFGTNGTLVPAGTKFSVQNAPTSVFGSNGNVTLGAGQNCVQTLSFSTVPASGSWTVANEEQATGALAYNISASMLQTAIRTLPFCSGCVVTGNTTSGFTVTFAGPGTGGLMVQPQFTTTSTLLDGSSAAVTVVPAITQPGIDQADVNVTATATGPIIANAGTLNNIVTPVSGLTNVLNVTDAILGRNVESDNAYRVRMAEELQIAGAGTVEAIRAKLLAVPGVTSALVYENTSDITDLNGRPPHSFEAVVSGGTDADIAETIWLAKPAGIASFGEDSYVITDSQGQNHTIFFSRPELVNIYITANLTVNLNFPADGDSLIQEILLTYVNGLGQGVSVVVDPYLVAQLASIPGIDDATLLVGTAPSPTESNNIPIEAFQQAASQSGFIIVNSTEG